MENLRFNLAQLALLSQQALPRWSGPPFNSSDEVAERTVLLWQTLDSNGAR